jgi:hypothetical protein
MSRMPSSHFTFDGEPIRQDEECAECGRSYRLIKTFILLDSHAYAIAYTALHRHSTIHEAWIDVILGHFGENTSDDHITFGCRVGPIEGQNEPAASLVTAAIPYGASSIWGQKLTREQAIQHPRLKEFWEVVDHLLLSDPEIHAHVYRKPAAR